uniref:(northern house mosquito) hypothetical protein n=1 Tax=Culex pipiens TaxID=7175 RepID=A0A8D8C0C0_CULPI
MIARSGRCCPEFGPAKIAAWFAEKKPKRKTFSLKVFFRQKNDTISDLTLTFPGHFYLFSAFSYSKYVMYWFALMSRGLLSAVSPIESTCNALVRLLSDHSGVA